jgi:hypothetical protein
MDGSLWGVILGGILAIAGGVAVAFWEQRTARAIRQEDRNLFTTAKVMESVVKIGQIQAWFVALKRTVDCCFDDAEEPGKAGLDPGVKVVPIVLSSVLVDEFSAEELANCLRSGDIGLLEELLDLQSNYRVTFELVRFFNQERNEFNAFTMNNASTADLVGGLAAQLEFDPKHKHGLEVRVAQLNQLVSEVMESYTSGLVKSEAAMSRFTSAMNSIPGIKVPKVNFVEGK